MHGVNDWLERLGLSEYSQCFADNAIDLSVLPDLTDQDLEKIGVLLGHRRKILKAIAALNSDRLARPMLLRRQARQPLHGRLRCRSRLPWRPANVDISP
jgi:hypothetical protein